MNTPLRFLLEGSATLAAGLLLWLFGDKIDVPVVDPVKIGVVAACLGAVELGYSGWLFLGRLRGSHSKG